MTRTKLLIGKANVNNIPIHADSKGGQMLAESEGFRARSKHIDVKHHFIRQKIEDGSVTPIHVPSEEMLADALTSWSGCKQLLNVANMWW